jgi:hypothetical protein
MESKRSKSLVCVCVDIGDEWEERKRKRKWVGRALLLLEKTATGK